VGLGVGWAVGGEPGELWSIIVWIRAGEGRRPFSKGAGDWEGAAGTSLYRVVGWGSRHGRIGNAGPRVR
jgi:hypothetical protein